MVLHSRVWMFIKRHRDIIDPFPTPPSDWPEMSTNLYSFSEETVTKLRKFRFASARSDKVQAVIYEIDKQSYEIREDSAAENPCVSIEELVEELPDNSPRYIVLSYPLTLKDGRKSSPLVMIYWLPPTAQQSMRMLYAAAVELFRDKAGVSKLIEISDEEDFEDIEEKVL